MKFGYFGSLFATLSLLLASPLQGALDWFAYVGAANSNTGNNILVPIDVNTHAVSTSIILPSSNNNTPPVGLAITPNRAKAFGASLSQENYWDVNLFTSTAANLAINNGNLFGVAISPDGTKAYIVNQDDDTIAVIDTGSGGVIDTITLPASSNNPFTIAITPDGKKGYVSDRDTNSVYVLDLVNNTVIGAPILVGNKPHGIAITPDGTQVFVGNRQSFSVSVISTATDMVIDTIALGVSTNQTVYDIAILPDGSKAYVSVEDPINRNTNPGQVFIIDIATHAVTPGPFVEPFPQGIAASPDGLQVFVANMRPNSASSSVSIIDTISNLVIDTIDLAPAFNARGLAITPDQAPIARFTFEPGTAGFPTTFDASTSTPSPLSPASVTIVRYDWNFGDGTTATTTIPIIQHTYAVPGDYTVVLTVTNSVGTSTTKVYTGHTMSRNGGPSAISSKVVTISAQNAPQPPQNLRARRAKNEFLTQTELLNILRWDAATTGEIPVEYKIYRNASLTLLAGIVPGNELVFVDHNRKKGRTYTYYVVAVDNAGHQSEPAIVTVRGSRR